MIMGNRSGTNGPFFDNLRKLSCVIVSIDYRLAPETRLPGIIEDVQDAWRWVREHGGQQGIDSDRLAVTGASAGGYHQGEDTQPRCTSRCWLMLPAFYLDTGWLLIFSSRRASSIVSGGVAGANRSDKA
jgi:hypothetical protein